MTVHVCVQAVIAIALALVLYVGSRSLVDVLDAGLVTRRVDALRVYARPHTRTHTHTHTERRTAPKHSVDALRVHARPHTRTHTHTHTDGQHRNIATRRLRQTTHDALRVYVDSVHVRVNQTNRYISDDARYLVTPARDRRLSWPRRSISQRHSTDGLWRTDACRTSQPAGAHRLLQRRYV